MQPGTPQSVVEDTLPGSGIRYKADEVLIGFGGLQQFPDTGWNGWTAASAANPLTAGSHPYARLLVTSPDYPLAQFRTYYLQSPFDNWLGLVASGEILGQAAGTLVGTRKITHAGARVILNLLPNFLYSPISMVMLFTKKSRQRFYECFVFEESRIHETINWQ